MQTRVGRKKMAFKWLSKLQNEYPHLAQRAETMNQSDGFIMKYDPKEVARREKKRSNKRKK